MEAKLKDKYQGCLMGMAVGDALGTTNEFRKYETVQQEPIHDMIGGGAFNLIAGQYTDDTAMGLCLAESLIMCHGEFNAADQMHRYVSWYEDGHWGSNGTFVDIGKTIRKALSAWSSSSSSLQHQEPLMKQCDSTYAGNGAIMRLAPIPLLFGDVSEAETALKRSGESSLTTHRSFLSVDACRYMSALILGCLSSTSKTDLLSATTNNNQVPFVPPGLSPDYWRENPLSEPIMEIANGSFRRKSPPDGIVASGYVVYTLEAALWAFYHSETFEEGALKIANLGNDADTAAAVYGQIAGAFYGISGIPQKWIQKIEFGFLIQRLALELYFLREQRSLGPHSERTPSTEIQVLMSGLYYLEEQYRDRILRRVQPSPRMYSHVSELEHDRDLLKRDFLDRFANDILKRRVIECVACFSSKERNRFGSKPTFHLNDVKEEDLTRYVEEMKRLWYFVERRIQECDMPTFEKRVGVSSSSKKDYPAKHASFLSEIKNKKKK